MNLLKDSDSIAHFKDKLRYTNERFFHCYQTELELAGYYKEMGYEVELDSDSRVRLKLTTRKGTRIESVQLKKLEKLANKTNLYWNLEDVWLILYGLS